jgi:hypothetical protein
LPAFLHVTLVRVQCHGRARLLSVTVMCMVAMTSSAFVIQMSRVAQGSGESAPTPPG